MIKINPKTPTKISESSCAVYSSSVSQLITFTDSEGNKLETSYANSIITIFNEGPIFARSHDKEVELIVTRPQGLKGDKGDKGEKGDEGIFNFEVRDGNLILKYSNLKPQADFHINEQGQLIATIN